MASNRKPHGYWNNFPNVGDEILTFNKESGTPGVMPTNEELIKAGRSDLSNAIRKHGGYLAVAKQLDLKLWYKAKPRRYWDNFENVKHELLALANQQASPGRMPTEDELRKAGLSTLANAIRKHGGVAVVAKILGLNLAYTAKPRSYWNDFANLEGELLNFTKKHSTSGVMPTKEELEKVGRSELIGAINKHGGFRTVAERLGLELAYTKKPNGYWDNFTNVERDLLKFVNERGALGVMPTSEELSQAGESGLASAILSYGGYPVVAAQLGLIFKRKPLGYWDDFASVKREILYFIKERGITGVMPMYKELEQNRRNDLINAIR